MIIGGREDKERDKSILCDFAERVGSDTLCIATVASTVGDELWEIYRTLFKELGIKKITHLDVVQRHDSVNEAALKAVHDADAYFFTGGDQLRITTELGGTPIADRILEVYQKGGLIGGTSAGASVMGEMMLVSGHGDHSYRIGSNLKMAPGLGFAKNVIIDQHFAERGRIGRLITATAHNPKFLGIGIDEDTAILMKGCKFKVMGAGAVYIVDAHQSTDSNLSEAEENAALSIFNVQLHLLSAGDGYDLVKKIPLAGRHSVMRKALGSS